MVTETYRVSVFTPGQKMIFRGKVVRTPVVFHHVKQTELALIDTQARRLMLRFATVKEASEIPPEVIKVEDLDIHEEDEDIEIEELESDQEPKTILETLISKDKK